MNGFVGIIPSQVEAVADRHRLTFPERSLLLHLLLFADHRTGEIRCTLIELGERLGIYRKNVVPKLDRLAEAGLIDHRFPRGHQGKVVVLCYRDLVHLGRTQRQTRSPENGVARATVRCSGCNAPLTRPKAIEAGRCERCRLKATA